MSDHVSIAERRSVLAEQSESRSPFTGNELTIVTARPAQRFSLRMDAAGTQAASQAIGFDLTQPINALRETSGESGTTRLSLRLGPDEWLLIDDVPDGDLDTRAAGLSDELGAVAHTLVDISHRNIAVELSGNAAADVLNTGCPLDLGGASFPVGTATRTLFAKSEIVLARRSDDGGSPLYRIECWRSFGRYLHAYLHDSATLIGINGPGA